MGASRFMSMVAAWLCVVAGCVLLWGSSAQALTLHEFAGAFGSEGSAGGQFKGPEWIAVNDVTHDVYVADHGNDRVEEFNSTGSVELGEFNGSGAPTGKFSNLPGESESVPGQIAIDNSGSPLTDPSVGDVYVVDSGHHVVDKFSASGAYVGQITGTPGGAFGALDGVAVDPSGVVWVLQENGEIYSFSDAGTNEYLSGRGTPDDHPGLALDSEDDFYEDYSFYVTKYNSSGERLVSLLGGQEEEEEEEKNAFSAQREVTGVAVDASGGSTGDEVYIGHASGNGTEGEVTARSLGGSLFEHFGFGYLTSGGRIAVDESNGTVYVSDRTADRVVVFDAFVVPSVSVEPVSEAKAKSLTLNGTVTPDGMPVTVCEFEYGTSTSYGHTVECEPSASSLGSGSSPEAVSAHLTGIVPGITYHYRLVAANSNQKRNLSPDEEFFTGPKLENVSVEDVASTSATLQAQIDPNGQDTRYYFQYGTTGSYGLEGSVSSGADLGSGSTAQTVSLHVQGLEADTAYHYRVVAIQEGEIFYAVDHAFTTQRAGEELALPDGREWELVSPPDKKGAVIEPDISEDGLTQAAADGSGITYPTAGPHVGEDPHSRSVVSTVLSRRGLDGWGSVDIDMPRRNINEGESANSLLGGRAGFYGLFSPDLSLAVAEPTGTATPPLSSEATERTLYVRNNANGSFLPLVTPANVPAGTKFGGEESVIHETEHNLTMRFITATPDLSHIVFGSGLSLTPEAVTVLGCGRDSISCAAQNLYEWAGGRLRLVNILPDGEATHEEIGGAYLGGEGFSENGLAVRPISADGRWVAWTFGTLYSNERQTYRGLFVRDMVGERTVKVGGPGAQFQAMSSNGSRIFFLENGELYVFNTATDVQNDLTANHTGEATAGVRESVSDVSEDGSYIYFVATGVLAQGGMAGADNLYLLHDGGSEWTTTYVATLSRDDEKSWFGTEGFLAPDLPFVDSRVSPDGRYLAFMSDRMLTGYDNLDANSGQPDEEVYLYDASDNRLVCASCNPTGARPIGVLDPEHSSLLVEENKDESWAGRWLAGSLPGWDETLGHQASYQPRYLSDNGRLFFDSADALVPQDTNGLEDVYEYEPPAGPGSAASDSCTMSSPTFSVSSNGCVNLISSGSSSLESDFYDASESGDDVFFLAASRLSSADYDTTYDVYDAHVCSVGWSCVAEPVSPPPCSSGDSCKAAPSPQPEIFGPAPSATFSGTGNVVEEAKKGSRVKHKHKVRSKRRAKPKSKRGKHKRGKAKKSHVADAGWKGGHR